MTENTETEQPLTPAKQKAAAKEENQAAPAGIDCRGYVVVENKSGATVYRW